MFLPEAYEPRSGEPTERAKAREAHAGEGRADPPHPPDQPVMTQQRQDLGLLGETLACAELERRGHTILERRFRTRRGELDIISRQNGFTVFVEVRAKSNETFGEPGESVTDQKQGRLVTMALEYVAKHRLEDSPCRFDVVAIETAFDPPRITVFEDAFRPGW